ncbi:MAG TPA: 30S ribosomal protein S27e [bacterium]|jgi:small subunit ribosomal protein S27e|uniref:Small ribosomal subunit protein eS27 n=6 Tax=Candidatus Marsarchaeota group 2 TaxID=2203771 RepID=A0A2R6CCT9_9ARCH|nr:MAG: 30S ribosomal protein S27e [Candidatus Marsarchaeota G2 archaeon OSP_D]PSN93580.1 MAG: 30S ribosomal protein S27e [Candidatus Marsarchaeota G2 archaeon ECH_B_SAG-C16]PSN96718.1 MAG: 30S ribosomal protein S27e [Candidatus Marsarchaeota G2 archaeon ECH_B_2]PSO01286.1 MAG: 30S ribosomal protein S27e [Candidatus Marsarchaeota G2 archaeon ECH_B_3]PSO03420.1 MAG: 30S ribosomal protein S27e [Candidatus Marsarchaeota G2 archaeon ECH_B_1]PSO08708.1 MAG: 30S ribosomal protein S27e [Candidatus Ma
MPHKDLVPKPHSRFYDVKCKECGNTQTIFSHAAMEVKCLICGAVLAKPTGGKAEIIAEIISEH